MEIPHAIPVPPGEESVGLARTPKVCAWSGHMRASFDSSERESLAIIVEREGALAVAVAASCSPTTVRKALRGERLQGPTLRALQGAITRSMVGEHAQHFAA